MPSSVIYAPLAMLASSFAILATIPMWWLTTIAQMPDPK